MQPESWPTTSSQLRQSLLLATTDGVPPTTVADGNEHEKKTTNAMKDVVEMTSHKVRVYPTRAQATLLNKWIGTARWTYNQVVAAIRKKTTNANKKDLRALLLNKASLVGTEYEWVLETPYDVRDEAMADVLKAIESNLAAKKKRFHLKFRSRKDEMAPVYRGLEEALGAQEGSLQLGLRGN
jgi:hypothetical protein